ncbi:MAG: hypothetical protein WAR77_04755 [Saprospiraceae bacterium]|nr:hypothetical protein [Saprospiraceae bacterium]
MKYKFFNQILKIAFVSSIVFNCTTLHAQIKVGNNPSTLDPNAALEIESVNKGLLLPRLALSSTTSTTPLSSFVPGMFVYNISTTNDITPGIYYSDGLKWIKVNAATLTNNWSLNGNSGTDSTNSFLGTTDNAPLLLKTNNTERLRITEDGNLGIGTTSPLAALHVKGQVIIDSFNTGNLANDNIIVANQTDGRLKMVPSTSFILGMHKRNEIVQNSGQTIFNTPLQIDNPDKIMLYRNGVMIAFTLNNSNSIVSEIPCLMGDEISILQLK